VALENRRRRYAIACFVALTIFAILARYVLFSTGILYGEEAAKTASLLVAGIIIAGGYLPIRAIRRDNASKSIPQETVAATLTAILGLALTGYAVSQLLAPNTPVAAAAAACGGTPVYGAPFFATTESNGVNARVGPGIEYAQVSRYGGGCTLGFDGYCIGPAVQDLILRTPDQRWLIVHDRAQMVAAGVVLSQSAESKLGTTPSPKCKDLGGLPRPTRIQQFSYSSATGRLRASAHGAVAVGYGLTTVSQYDRSYQVVALGTGAGFPASLSPAQIASEIQVAGGVWLGASICLADGVPVVPSLQVDLLIFKGSRLMRQQPDVHVPRAVRRLLAEVACNGTGL
jgi:hypothetical protein